MNKPHTFHARARAAQAGFTLIEMLIVMAVLVVLMPMGVSQLNGLFNSLKLTAAANRKEGVQPAAARTEAKPTAGWTLTRGEALKGVPAVKLSELLAAGQTRSGAETVALMQDSASATVLVRVVIQPQADAPKPAR